MCSRVNFLFSKKQNNEAEQQGIFGSVEGDYAGVGILGSHLWRCPYLLVSIIFPVGQKIQVVGSDQHSFRWA